MGDVSLEGDALLYRGKFMERTDAWVICAGRGEDKAPTQLKRETWLLSACTPEEALVEPLYGCWEANMTHALQRAPIDVARQRGEDRVVLGNCGLVRILRPAANSSLREGDLCIIGNGALFDRFGYPTQVWGYDWPQSMGFLAKRVKVHSDILVRIPSPTRFSLIQWASFGVRYATAYSNWQVAYPCFRSQVSIEDLPRPFVWGWGGGSSLAGLHLARLLGFPAAMLTSHPDRQRLLTQMGIQAVDRRAFGDLNFQEDRFARDAEYRRKYRESEQAFADFVNQATDGLGVSIFFDYLGSSVLRATLRALGRQGVLSTAGWKHGPALSILRSLECLRRHIHVHTHYCRRGHVQAAMDFAEQTGWMSPIEPDEPVWSFDQIDALARDYVDEKINTYFPIYQVNPL